MEKCEMKFCQSCAMPLGAPDMFGTNADGSRNEDYCAYCYKGGAFTSETTMDEMIEMCVPFVSKGDPWPDEETARKAMQEMFPQLKRWRK
ncbi:MAG: transcriptional regulator [Ruminiclostridium sp.]|nr:transcriptional regulator [Ruminiclostridium sp.]